MRCAILTARAFNGVSPAGAAGLLIFALALGWSAFHPAEPVTWWLEATPVLLGASLLAATRRRLPLTPLSNWLLLLGAVMVLIGAHYTFAEVPAFNWLRDALGLQRNHYDRVGHFFQGFIAAIIFRELLLRTSPLRPGRWLVILTQALSLGKSVLYEFLEWGAAIIFGEGATAFLGTQGDVWDAHWDMALAFAGAITAQALLARLHDRQLTAPG